jgi:hypothetical protein
LPEVIPEPGPDEAGRTLRRRKICNALIAIAAVHFAVFVATIVMLGGDALTGRVEDGHWFLGNHGQFLEVSHTAWLLSAILGRTLVYGTFPLGVIAALLRPRKPGRDRPRFWWKG